MDRLEEVLLQQPLANLPFRTAAEQHPVRHHDAEPARGVQHRHHVLDEREVPLRLRRHAEPEARIGRRSRPPRGPTRRG